MRSRLPLLFVSALVGILALPADVACQKAEVRRISAAVTYISGSSLYIGAGTRGGLAAGDTLALNRAERPVGLAVITAVSSSSASAQIVRQVIPPAVGDSATITKTFRIEEAPPPPRTEIPATSRKRSVMDGGSNAITGRFALQYGMAGVMGSRPDYSAPAAVMRLDVARLFGTGLTLSFHGRTSYDLENRATFSGQPASMNWRVYELALSSEDTRSWYGYSVGRVMSRFVGGLGVVDGGQVFARSGGFTLGALAGLQPNFSTSALDPTHQKVAGFVNYAWGESVFAKSDITLAYGQEMLQGRLDRNFLYIQTSLRFGSELFLYQSTELDLHGISNGVRNNKPGFTNSFVTVTYAPLSWLTVNGGYDATRSVYLFETMKSIADTLLDRTLKEGFRASVGFRLPLNIVLGASGNLRLASGSTPSAHTLGGTVRMSDIAGSGVQLGTGYTHIQGLYNTGNDITVDCDAWISRNFSAALRLDNFRYTVAGGQDPLRTITASASLSCTFTRSIYGILNFDQVWDSIQDAQRVFLEIGVHF